MRLSFLITIALVAILFAQPVASSWQVPLPSLLSSKSGVTKPVKGTAKTAPTEVKKGAPKVHEAKLTSAQSARLKERVSAATPRIRELMRGLGPGPSKYLEKTCSDIPKGEIPNYKTVLGGLGKRNSLEQLLPRRSNLFAHRYLNRGTCSSVGGTCISNYTLPKHPDDILSKFSWGRCAVVGNSGSLLTTRYGQAIDRHDLVVRMNIAPTGGKEEHVGSKTTLRLINSKWARLYAQGSSMVGVGRKTHLVVRVVDNADFYVSLVKALARKKSETMVLMLNTNTVRAAQKLLDSYRVCMYFSGRRFAGGVVPSSGFVLALALSQLCDRVNIYGFGRPKFQGKLVPYQYYIERNNDGSVNQGSENHSFAMELIVLQEMARASKGKFNYCSISESGTRICRNLDKPTASAKGAGNGAGMKAKQQRRRDLLAMEATETT